MGRTARRQLLGVLLAVLVLATACTSAVSGRPRTSIDPANGTHLHASAQRPNIVFVLTDDLATNLLPYLPHVQALARSGTSLSNYYVTDSLCCPSRTAIFTGQYAHNNGVFTNHGADGGYDAYNRNGDQQKAFVLPLHAAGYRTGFMGKYLNDYQPADPPAPGWDEWDVAGSGYREFDYTLNEDGRQQKYGHRPQDYLTDVLSAKAGNFVDSATQHQQPFFLELATFAPHSPYVPAPRYANRYPGLQAPRNPSYDTTPTGALPWLARFAPLTARQRTNIDDVYRKRVQADLAVDDLIAHVEQRLAAAGVARNTYIVFSSDNGYHLGDYRLLPGKQTAFDTDIHVPLVVSGPGVPAGQVSPRLGSNIDLAPTFLDLTHTTSTVSRDGVSLAPLLRGRVPATWQQSVLVEHHKPADAPQDPDRQTYHKGEPPTYAAVRTADGLYVKYVDGAQEYYDTRTDPYELHNIAAQGVPDDLKRALVALQRCRGATQCQAAAQVP